MKKKTTLKSVQPEAAAMVLHDAVAVPELGLTVPVRVAKAKFSALLELAAAGREVTITSDGRPKAMIVPVERLRSRKVFTGTMARLRHLPVQTAGPMAEELIRTDRDGRGW